MSSESCLTIMIFLAALVAAGCNESRARGGDASDVPDNNGDGEGKFVGMTPGTRCEQGSSAECSCGNFIAHCLG